MKKSLTQHLNEMLIHSHYSTNIRINIDKSKTPELYSVVEETKSILIDPPIPTIKLEAQCRNRIQLQANKSNGMSKQGLLIGYQRVNEVERLQYLKNGQEEGIGSMQEGEQCLCIGIAISRDNENTFMKRIGKQLRSCLESQKHHQYRKNFENKSKLQAILKEYYKLLRMFLILEPSKKLIHNICFFPNISFYLKEIKLNPYKFVAHPFFQQVMKFQLPQSSYGYLSQDTKGRFILVDKEDPTLSETALLIGVWIYIDDKSKQVNHDKLSQPIKRLIWTSVSQYLMNPSIKRASTLKKNTGLLFVIEKNHKKPNCYLFDTNNLNLKYQWTLKQFSQPIEQIPTSFNFSNNNQIIQQDQKQSQTISISNKVKSQQGRSEQKVNSQIDCITQRQFQRNQIHQHSDSKSQKSFDDKDVQIKLLKQEVQFYKKQCQEYKKIVEILTHQTVAHRYDQQFIPAIFPSAGWHHVQQPSLYSSRYHPQVNSNYSQINPNYPYFYNGFHAQPPLNQFNQNKNTLNDHNTKLQVNDLNFYKPTEDDINQSVELKPPTPIYTFPQKKQQELTFARSISDHKYENRAVEQNEKVFLKKNYSLEKQFKSQKPILQNKQSQHQSVSDLKNMSFGQQNNPNQYQFQSSVNIPKFNNSNVQQNINRSPQFKVNQTQQQPLKSYAENNHKLFNSFNSDDKEIKFQKQDVVNKQSQESHSHDLDDSSKQINGNKYFTNSDSDESDEQVKKLQFKYTQRLSKN